MSLFIIENISSILASIISINSELFMTLLLVSSVHVFNIISLSLSINDFRAKPYCLFSFSASCSEMLKTKAISCVMLFPPNGIVFVYLNSSPSNTPMSVFSAPTSNNITLSYNSFLSNTRFLSASVTGIIPSISTPALLNMLVIFLI